MSRPLRIALVAGEASGDTLGAGLLRALKAQHGEIEAVGIGGPQMIAEGFESWFPMERLSVMGITEVVGRLPELLGIRRNLVEKLQEWQPDVFIGIDAPDFNLGVEKRLKQAGIKTAHYVSPSVWAWRKGRVKKIRQAVDHMLTLLPFEADFYREEAVPVTFVGHTLADSLPLEPDVQSARDQINAGNGDTLLAVLPGSRRSEVEKLLPLFLDVVTQLMAKIPSLKVIIPAANEARLEQIEAVLADRSDLPVEVLLKQADLAIAAADAVLVASGTATLQTLLWKKPMVVAYKVSAFSYWLISTLATTQWVALPNILEQKTWVPERLQKDAQVDILVADLEKALADDDYRQQFQARALHWHKALARNADARAAEAILKLAAPL